MSIERTMDKIAEVPEIDEFLAGPLVTWFTSCLEMVTDEKVTYDNLVNGYLIHNVFLQMNLQVHDTDVYPSTVDSAAWRSRNLLAILNNIRRYYEDELGQVILRLPDVEKLGREPEHHVREIELLLGLLLGCAVKCPKNRGFIEKITKFDEASQLAIAECIAQIIEVPDIVLSAEMLGDLPNAQKAIECVRKICNERDEYKIQLRHYREHEEEQLSEDLCEKLQLKFKATSLQEQLRQKSNELEDTQAELKECEKKLRDLMKVHEKLALEAKNVKLYRDELDEAKDSAEKVERLEQDIARYRKKLADFDFCRARLKEFENTNKNLIEREAVLETQIICKKSEREKMKDLKKQVTKLTEQVSNLTTENAESRDKYLAVCEERKELQRLVKESFKQSHANHRYEGIPSLQDDLLLNQTKAEISKLQADNQSLTKYIETLKQSLFQQSDKNSTLTRENKELLKNLKQEVNRSKSLQYICNAALGEAKKLQQQGMENLRSMLENTQKRTSSYDNCVPKNPIAANRDMPKVQKEQKCPVGKPRKSYKHVINQS